MEEHTKNPCISFSEVASAISANPGDATRGIPPFTGRKSLKNFSAGKCQKKTDAISGVRWQTQGRSLRFFKCTDEWVGFAFSGLVGTVPESWG